MKTCRLFLTLIIAGLGVGASWASVVTNGTEITFIVDEGHVETYNESIATTITRVNKEGKGTMRLTQAGCNHGNKVSIYIKAGILAGLSPKLTS